MDALFHRCWIKIKKKEYMVPFFSAVFIGIFTHIFLFVNKFPNADAMTNFYFDQNMVTSGRWFLTVVCGISSYYDLNWIIGSLSILYLAFSAVMISEFFEVKSNVVRFVIGALLVTFPAVTATFAYLYTADGYMLAFLLSILAAYFTKRYKYGFVPGAFCLALSMGSYQAYLAVTILLCLFWLIRMCLQNATVKEMWKKSWRFLAMGVGGGVIYYVLLKVCLFLQGKTLDTYQGIDEMGKISVSALPGMLWDAFRDFGAFALKGNIFISNGFSFGCVVLLGMVVLWAALFCYINNKVYKKWCQTLLLLVFVCLLPFATNVIYVTSTEVVFHLLMRLQWVIYPIFAVVLCDTFGQLTEGREEGVRKDNTAEAETKTPNKPMMRKKVSLIVSCVGVLAALGLSYQFILMDNIAYFNMNERYEKTYAYCLRLLDRMEQTPGYEQGMPVAMIGVLDETKYPATDITGDVTSGIYGTTGDMLIYKGEQYAAFMKHYMNVTINPVVGDQIIEIYNSPEYREMDSFPAENSVRIVDGVMYIKTEPKE